MKQYIEIKCRYCGADDLVKNGRSENGTQRYRCNECGKNFQNEYSYNAWKPGVKDQIEKQTLNSGGVRDIGRNLGISKNTVISELKKNSRRSESLLFAGHERIGGRNKDGCRGR